MPGTDREKADARINVPLCIDGVTVNPGVYIFADCDGVVVIPQDDAETVFEKALAKYEKEKEILRRILAGESTMDIYGFRNLSH